MVSLQLKDQQQQLLNYLHEATAVTSSAHSFLTAQDLVHIHQVVCAHTIVVLSNVKGEFTDGETCTGSNHQIQLVQHSSIHIGAKGFEQKAFNQTKGISMAGSESNVFTANVDLTSTFGEHRNTYRNYINCWCSE